jgi:hypothetical protein
VKTYDGCLNGLKQSKILISFTAVLSILKLLYFATIFKRIGVFTQVKQA